MQKSYVKFVINFCKSILVYHTTYKRPLALIVNRVSRPYSPLPAAKNISRPAWVKNRFTLPLLAAYLCACSRKKIYVLEVQNI